MGYGGDYCSTDTQKVFYQLKQNSEKENNKTLGSNAVTLYKPSSKYNGRITLVALSFPQKNLF